MSKKRPPASIGAKSQTLGEQFGRLEDRIQKIGVILAANFKTKRSRHKELYFEAIVL